MTAITLEQANRIIEAALAKGREMNLAPLSVAVLDAGGHPKALAREDDQSFMRVYAAQSKAWGSLALGVHSRHIAKRYEQEPRQAGFINALNDLSTGRVIPLPGAVLVRADSGEILGAVGVAGAASEDDEVCAVAGVEAIGLSVDLE
jgi:uncharacterized protein GlcG (DUF336 family)